MWLLRTFLCRSPPPWHLRLTSMSPWLSVVGAWGRGKQRNSVGRWGKPGEKEKFDPRINNTTGRYILPRRLRTSSSAVL